MIETHLIMWAGIYYLKTRNPVQEKLHTNCCVHYPNIIGYKSFRCEHISEKTPVWMHICRHTNRFTNARTHRHTPRVALGPLCSLSPQKLCIFHTSKVATQTKLKLIWPHSIIHTHTRARRHMQPAGTGIFQIFNLRNRERGWGAC